MKREEPPTQSIKIKPSSLTMWLKIIIPFLAGIFTLGGIAATKVWQQRSLETKVYEQGIDMRNSCKELKTQIEVLHSTKVEKDVYNSDVQRLQLDIDHVKSDVSEIKDTVKEIYKIQRRNNQ